MGTIYEFDRPWITNYQRLILESEARYTVTEAATKCGKTASHIIWLLEAALTHNKRGGEAWWIAPIYQQAKIAFTRMRNQVKLAGNENFFKVNETELTLTLPTGVVIRFKSAEKPDNLFGEDVFAAVFDEFTRAREEAWFALRSTLTATNGRCKLIGNAKGKKNWGYKLGVRAKNGEKGYEYFKITIYDALREGVPGITLEEIEQAKRDLPEVVFKELYLAEPSEDGSNPFGPEAIRRNIKPISTLPVLSYGIDLAKYTDWTVITGLDLNGDVSFFERFQKDWAKTQERIIEVVKNTPAHIDSTGVGDPIVEFISKHCPMAKGFKYTSITKQQLIEGLASAINQNKVSLLSGAMQDEAESFEFEYHNGRVSYNAPSGSHDDCVNSLALAWDCKLHNPQAVWAFA